jgi:hypothetical protein
MHASASNTCVFCLYGEVLAIGFHGHRNAQAPAGAQVGLPRMTRQKENGIQFYPGAGLKTQGPASTTRCDCLPIEQGDSHLRIHVSAVTVVDAMPSAGKRQGKLVPQMSNCARTLTGGWPTRAFVQ